MTRHRTRSRRCRSGCPPTSGRRRSFGGLGDATAEGVVGDGAVVAAVLQKEGGVVAVQRHGGIRGRVLAGRVVPRAAAADVALARATGEDVEMSLAIEVGVRGVAIGDGRRGRGVCGCGGGLCSSGRGRDDGRRRGVVGLVQGGSVEDGVFGRPQRVDGQVRGVQEGEGRPRIVRGLVVRRCRTPWS